MNEELLLEKGWQGALWFVLNSRDALSGKSRYEFLKSNFQCGEHHKQNSIHPYCVELETECLEKNNSKPGQINPKLYLWIDTVALKGST